MFQGGDRGDAIVGRFRRRLRDVGVNRSHAVHLRSVLQQLAERFHNVVRADTWFVGELVQCARPKFERRLAAFGPVRP